MQPKRKDNGKKHIQGAVLCERQQGERRHRPHHGTGYNQRHGGSVQLQAHHPKGVMGCERQQGERQEQGSHRHQPLARQHQGANHQALSASFRP